MFTFGGGGDGDGDGAGDDDGVAVDCGFVKKSGLLLASDDCGLVKKSDEAELELGTFSCTRRFGRFDITILITHKKTLKQNKKLNQ